MAVVKNSSGSFEVDRDGVLYTVAKPAYSKIPEISGLAGSFISPGRHVQEHPSGAGVMRILSTVPAQFPRRLVSVRVIRPDYVELRFDGNILVKADPAVFPRKIESLRRVFEKLDRTAAEPPRAISYIDVRFQQDVVAYHAVPSDRVKGKGR